ncbi:flagellar hook-associated protein FlgL [Actinomycetaceae bacterium L2_0104]
MIGRVTQSSIQSGSLHHLQKRMSSQANLHEQLSSGNRVNRPSDDPAGSVDIMRIRSQQRADTQYERNVNNAISWLTTIDDTLTTVSSRLTKARTLVLQGANSGAMSENQRGAIANEIEAIGQALVGLANTSYNGRFVFAGTSAADSAFTVQEDPATGEKTYAHTGYPDATVERRVADATSLRIDSDGAHVFGEGVDSVFALMDRIAQDLRDGKDISGYVDQIDAVSSRVLQEAGRVGSRVNQATEAKEAILNRSVTLASQLQAVEEIDTPAALIELSTLETAYQIALASTARVLQPSLLDHLR